MSLWRDWVSWLLIVVAVGCLVVAAFPQWSDWVDPATGDKVRELRLGLWFSPFYQHVHRERANGGFITESGVNWLSWSSLIVLLGLVSLEILRWRRNVSAGQRGQEHGAQQQK